MSQAFTKAMARNIFYGGSVFFFLLFLGLTFDTHNAWPERDNHEALTESVAHFQGYGQVNDHVRVIDVVRDSLFLFAEALDATGDRFGIFGFSSRKRDPVRMHLIKGFDECYGGAVRGRIQAIKPGYYTRMGAAVRHATTLLADQPAGRRLLLLLTDGKPNDLDKYEGRYGIEDTRRAVQEARHLGLQPFCVTIDAKGNDYLPHLFGKNGYIVIRRPSELPKRLPLLYAQLTA